MTERKTDEQKQEEQVQKAREQVAGQVQEIDELDPTPETEPGKGEKKYDGGEIPRVAKRGSDTSGYMK